MNESIIRFEELSSKDVSDINQEQLLANLKRDLLKYELILSSDKSDQQLIDLFNLSNMNNVELIQEVKKFQIANSQGKVSIEDKSGDKLLNLHDELSLYHEKLLILQSKMGTRLNDMINERNELYAKCQLLLDKLE